MPVTIEDHLKALNEEYLEILGEEGIDLRALARCLKEELAATETRVFFNRNDGTIHYSAPLVAWGVRQRARMDAQELLKVYPAKRTEGRTVQQVEIKYVPPEEEDGV